MSLVERVVFFMVLAALCVGSMAEVYKVGDDNGWTAKEHMPDYEEWSASKAFKIGDSIVFEYDPEWHNVVQVTHEDYRKCNASSPIKENYYWGSHSIRGASPNKTKMVKTFTSGKDTIPIKAEGHLFYICGVPEHCKMGQKVDIRVVALDRLDIGVLADRATPAPPTSPSVSAPTPSPNSVMSISKGFTGKLGFVILAVCDAPT
ncbi:chemocyanin-like [Papaver somniferum]|uniref:chemocyanin-like n=1 Tax=Papaver somniferum TaxID=3469 RepID=UPI000E6FB23E|nr:chemocyanin-like [Papaver somniferum]